MSLEEKADNKGTVSEKGVYDAESNQETALPWTFTRVIAIAALCIAYVGSQIILYFVGGALSYIAADINTTIPNWLLTANTLAVAGICPFVGYLTDLLGRRWITVFGALLLVISSIIMATTKSLGSAVTGMAIGGIGAGICELTAIAGVAEITPVKWRGVSLAVVTFSILPFIPYLIYIQQLQLHASWRWSLAIVGIWNFIGLIGILLCYRPPPRHNVDGLSSASILKRIDYLGAFLSIGGVTLFLVGLQAGGYQFPWTSGETLGPLISGLVLIVAFVVWEGWFAPYPMAPKEIFQGQYVVGLSFAIVFIAGMNFYSILGFFPLLLQTFYDTTPLEIGIRAIGYPLAILIGACLVNALLSYTNGHVRQMFFISAAMMTAFGGALAMATPFNPNFAVVMATFDSFGIGAIIVPTLSTALYACPDRYIGTTAALSLSIRFLGGSVGTAIYYNIFNSNIMTKLPNYVGTAAVQAGLPAANVVPFVTAIAGGQAAAAAAVPGVTTEILGAGALAARWAFADSLQYVWYATIAFGVVCMGLCACMPNIKRFMTNRVAVDLH